jgi:hypothetical protein
MVTAIPNATMEIWVPTLVTKVRDVVLRLLMVVNAVVETIDRVIASLIGALDAGSRDIGLG